MAADDSLEVVWDGSHRGQDLDLLNVDARVAVKRQGCLRPIRATSSRDVILDVLRTGVKVTLNELCECTGLPQGTVNSELYQLRMKGQLGHRDSGRRSPMGRGLREYWLIEPGHQPKLS